MCSIRKMKGVVLNSNVLKMVKDGTRGEEHYSIHLNSNENRAPPWPKAQLKNEMFILPKKMGINDKIVIEGVTFDQRRQLKIGLVTGYENPDPYNVACQLDIDFNDKITIQTIQNGESDLISKEHDAQDYFSDLPYFNVTFRVRTEAVLDLFVGTSFMVNVELKHNINDIRFLNVQGDVAKVSRLDFQFG